MSNTVDIVKGHLINNVKDLIVNLGVSHREIINDIHNAVIELGNELPKTQVLYNGVYGGYGLSKAFLDYVAKHDPELDQNDLGEYSKEFRIEAVKHIVPFGLEVLHKYPFLKDLLVIYHHYNFNTILNNISSTHYNEKTLQAFYKRKKELENILSIPALHGNKTVRSNWFDNEDSNSENDKTYEDNKLSLYDIAHYTYITLGGYTKETYEKAIEYINKEIETKLKYNEDYKSKCLECNITEEMFNDIKQVVYDIKKEEEYTKKKYDISFIDAINKYGIYDHKVWECQSRYNSLAMQYLLIKSKNYISKETKENSVYDFALSNTDIMINDEDYNKIIRGFALESASSRYCSLRIGEVSQYVSWYVGEYDGKESICFR